MHPVGGADHLLAMLAVGVFAAVLGGRARVSLPLGFLGGMLLGFVAALAGLPLPQVEPMILASVIALGLLVAFAARPSGAAATVAVLGFGLFHGHAHGTELGAASALVFGLGFLAGTAALHAAGVALGSALAQSRLVRTAAGTATALAGVALSFA
jgi:urease accessory protein